MKEKSSIYPAALKLGGSAQYLSVSKQTMRRLIAKGEIKPIRKVRHLLIPIEELNRWLQK